MKGEESVDGALVALSAYMRRYRWSVVCGIALLHGCGGEVEGDFIEDDGEAIVATNGVALNGVKFNGVKFNGVKFNGVKFNGSSATGSLKLSGSMLQGTAGQAVLGATLIGTLANGSTVTLKITDVAVTGDKHRYLVTSAGVPLCRDAAGNGISAYALAGRWNESEGVSGGGAWINDGASFTFACRNAALGKCVDWGYRPWASTTLRNYHQACTRMVRADYCGDGKSYTKEGVRIDIYDRLGIQKKTLVPNGINRSLWGLSQAEWSVDGAVCIDRAARFPTAQIPTCRPLSDCAGFSLQQNTINGVTTSTFTPKWYPSSLMANWINCSVDPSRKSCVSP